MRTIPVNPLDHIKHIKSIYAKMLGP